MQMAEQPTADSKPAIDSWPLLHAKISEVNTKGKKINHVIKVFILLRIFSSFMVSQLLISSFDLCA